MEMNLISVQGVMKFMILKTKFGNLLQVPFFFLKEQNLDGENVFVTI